MRTASDDGHIGHQGYVTDLLAVLLEGDDAASAAVYACGPPAMLEVVREMCAEREVAAELAMETPMACGFGSCFGCAVPTGGWRLHASLRRRTGGAGGRDRERADRGIGTLTDLSLEICGIQLEHPVLNGSGTFDAIAARRSFGDQLDASFPFSAFVSKTITPEPRAGNPPPRLFETPAGMLNSIGLPNKGLEGFLIEDLPQLARLGVPLIVSVMAPSREGFATLVSRVGGRREVAAIELNVSCPNVSSGLIVGEQPAETLSLLAELRELTDKPLVVKLTPNVADPAAVARAAEQGGADAVSLINTLRATGLSRDSDDPWLGAGSGGLSGPAVHPVALDQVRRVAAEVTIPVIGMGGIETGGDALAMLDLGASAVAVGTATFRDPLAATRIRSELVEELRLGGSSGCPGAPRRLPQVEVDANFSENPQNPLARHASGDILAAADDPLGRHHHHRRPREVPRAANARPFQGKRDPFRARPAEARPQGTEDEDRDAAARPARVCDVGKGLRHDPRGAEVRSREGEQDPQPLPDLSVEDDRRALRAPTRRARSIPS